MGGQLCAPTPTRALFCLFSPQFFADYWYLPGNSLPALGGDSSSITMSGASGGSATSSQMHVIYSDVIKGVGLTIGGVYGEPLLATENFAQKGIEIAENLESRGLIDSLENLKGDPVWIFTAEQDTLYGLPNQEAQLDFYNYFQSNTEFISYDVDHNIPTVFAEGEFIRSGYDTIGVMLAYVLTNLQVSPISSLAPPDYDYQRNGVLRRFSQWEFLETSVLQPHGLAEYGYVYYPYQCIDGSIQRCKVHMVLPGCGQTVVFGGFSLMNDFGYGHYASSNDLIIIYAQQKWDWYNPISCMGFRGHSSWWTEDYLTNKDPQMKALRAMLERVTDPRNSQKYDYVARNLNIYNDSNFLEEFWWQPFLFIKFLPEYIGGIFTLIVVSITGFQ